MTSNPITARGKLYKKRMTLIVGVVCQDAIVMGAERETTHGNHKSQYTQKITCVEFKNGWVIVGEAGSADWSGVTLEKFRRIATNTTIDSDQTIEECILRAFREALKQSIAPPIGTRECQDFFRYETNSFYLTVAHYYNGKARLNILNPVFGLAIPQSAMALIGIGDDLAQYLLKGTDFTQLESMECAASVFYVVNEVKKSVSGCGGTTDIVLMSNGKKPEILNEDSIRYIDEKVQKFADSEKLRRTESLSHLIGEFSPQYRRSDIENPAIGAIGLSNQAENPIKYKI